MALLKYCTICRRTIWPWQRRRYTAVLQLATHRSCWNNVRTVIQQAVETEEEESSMHEVIGV